MNRDEHLVIDLEDGTAVVEVELNGCHLRHVCETNQAHRLLIRGVAEFGLRGVELVDPLEPHWAVARALRWGESA